MCVCMGVWVCVPGCVMCSVCVCVLLYSAVKYYTLKYVIPLKMCWLVPLLPASEGALPRHECVVLTTVNHE